jgi:hypothetical protein
MHASRTSLIGKPTRDGYMSLSLAIQRSTRATEPAGIRQTKDD